MDDEVRSLVVVGEISYGLGEELRESNRGSRLKQLTPPMALE